MSGHPRYVARRRSWFGLELDWAYVSRRFVISMAVLAAMGALAIYKIVQPPPSPSARAQSAIADAAETLGRAQTMPHAARFRSRLGEAESALAAARMHLTEGSPPEALARAIEARSIAQKLLEGTTGWDALIVDTDGKVEVQAVGQTTWESAKDGRRLWEGDFLKTGSSGSAEVMTADGTVVVVKPDTLFEVGRTRSGSSAQPGSEMKIIAGTLTTATGSQKSTIVTDSGTARLNSRTQGQVDVEPKRETRVLVFDGSARVDAPGSQGVTLSGREGVRVAAGAEGRMDRLSVPDAPRLLSPEENASFPAVTKPVQLKWTPSQEAVKYRFQIAESRLFVPESLLADVENREKPEASLNVRTEGTFFWRVAAVSRAGLASAWSKERRFRIGTVSAAGGRPPELLVFAPRVIGESLVSVSGRTEPGASVAVNGEVASTDAQGAFKKVVPVRRSGMNAVQVTATNGAGLVTRQTVRVLVTVE